MLQVAHIQKIKDKLFKIKNVAINIFYKNISDKKTLKYFNN